MKIAIMDYGIGNLKNVQKALQSLGYEGIITADGEEILSADKVILPGVGHFGDAMNHLRNTGLHEVVYQVIQKEIPLLGICVGMQLLFEGSEEAPGIEGLGILKGHFKRFDNSLIVPHMGWNALTVDKESILLQGIAEESYVYFVHSYYLEVEDNNDIVGTTVYGKEYGVAIERNKIFATQFHPEKSGGVGLQILRNFGGTN